LSEFLSRFNLQVEIRSRFGCVPQKSYGALLRTRTNYGQPEPVMSAEILNSTSEKCLLKWTHYQHKNEITTYKVSTINVTFREKLAYI